MRMFAIAAALVLAGSVTVAQAQERTPSPAGAKVYFENLKDGAKVTSPRDGEVRHQGHDRRTRRHQGPQHGATTTC